MQEVKVDGTERALKTGNRIAPEFAHAVCGLDHATRQQLVSVLSKAQTKRCVATSATAAFDKCTEVSARPLGEEGMLQKKRPKKKRPKKTPKQPKKQQERTEAKCPVKPSASMVKEMCISMCNKLLGKLSGRTLDTSLVNNRLCEQPDLWRRIHSTTQKQRCNANAMETNQERCTKVCGQTMGSTHDSCGMMTIGSKERRTTQRELWIEQDFEDLMLVNSQSLEHPQPKAILKGRERFSMMAPTYGEMMVDMCKPASTGRILCVNQYLRTQNLKVTSTNPKHQNNGTKASTQRQLLQSLPPSPAATYNYKSQQLMLKVTSCRADGIENQCIRKENIQHLNVLRGDMSANAKNSGFLAKKAELNALRRTVVPKLQCETHTISEIIDITPCKDGGWDKLSLTHNEPILDMLDSEMVFTEGMTHW